MPYMTYFKNGKIVGCGNAEDDIPKGIDTVDFNNPKLTDAQIEKRINNKTPKYKSAVSGSFAIREAPRIM